MSNSQQQFRPVWRNTQGPRVSIEESHGMYFISGHGWVSKSEMEDLLKTVESDLGIQQIIVGPPETKGG